MKWDLLVLLVSSKQNAMPWHPDHWNYHRVNAKLCNSSWAETCVLVASRPFTPNYFRILAPGRLSESIVPTRPWDDDEERSLFLRYRRLYVDMNKSPAHLSGSSTGC